MTELDRRFALARELIDVVRWMEVPRIAALDKRITDTLAYIESVVDPNEITLEHIKNYLTGKYDTVPMPEAEDPDAKWRALFTRRWVCDVVASGFHNGAGCTADDPHDSHCRYLWTARFTDKKAAELGMTPEETT